MRYLDVSEKQTEEAIKYLEDDKIRKRNVKMTHSKN